MKYLSIVANIQTKEMFAEGKNSKRQDPILQRQTVKYYLGCLI